MIYDPVQSPLEYVMFSRPRPWSLNFGDIISERFEDRVLRIKFKASKKEAQKSERWHNNKAILEVIDADGYTVYEAWLDFSEKPTLIGEICLRHKK